MIFEDLSVLKKIIDAGIETAGLLTVQRNSKTGCAIKSINPFTEKYSLTFVSNTWKCDKSGHILKVKLADEELLEVTESKSSQEKMPQ